MHNHLIINIGRQFGSGGKSIGELLAKRLGVKLYDKELLLLAARESGFAEECFEQRDEQREGLRALFGHFRIPFVGNYQSCDSPLSGEALFRIQSDVIRRVAERESCIFVGRCADYILRERTDTINLFFTADTKDRVRRITSRTGCTTEEAEAKIEAMDRQRARYYNYYTSRTWGEAASYDLTINTSRLGEEGTVDLVIDFINKRMKIND